MDCNDSVVGSVSASLLMHLMLLVSNIYRTVCMTQFIENKTQNTMKCSTFAQIKDWTESTE